MRILIPPLPRATPRAFTNHVAVRSTAGSLLAEIETVPEAYVDLIAKRLRRAPQHDRTYIAGALRRAGDAFLKAELAGLSLDEYTRLVGGATGMSPELIRDSVGRVGGSIGRAPELGDRGLVREGRWSATDAESAQGFAQYRPHGRLLSVVAPGNGPGIHALWPQSLAFGYCAMVRPSTREPFTAQRVVAALHGAGLADSVALVPTGHEAISRFVEASDRAIVYGDEQTVAPYRNHAKVLVQGPGRSKILIGPDACPGAAMRLVYDSVMNLGGAACVCASAVLVCGDAHELATKFLEYARARTEPEGTGWATSRDYGPRNAERIQLARSQFVDELVEGQGSDLKLPLVFCVPQPGHPLVSTEFAFPAVTFAPVRSEQDARFLSGSLVVTALTRDPDWKAHIQAVPDVRNLFFGEIPTTWMDHTLPHDGYLAEFLVTTRTYREV